MERTQTQMKQAKLWLKLVYGFGVPGLWWPVSREYFLLLTPLTLLGGALTLLWFEEKRDNRFWWVMGLTWLAGFGVEVAGVKTGAVFGAYGYGSVLGPKLAEVPLVIGLNWTILLFAIYQWVAGWSVPAWTRPVWGALVLVGTDFFIEPVAVKLGFWTWDFVTQSAWMIAPAQNYLAWGLFSFLVLALYQLLGLQLKNRLSASYWLYQLLFFAALAVLL